MVLFCLTGKVALTVIAWNTLTVYKENEDSIRNHFGLPKAAFTFDFFFRKKRCLQRLLSAFWALQNSWIPCDVTVFKRRHICVRHRHITVTTYGHNPQKVQNARGYVVLLNAPTQIYNCILFLKI